MPERSVARVGVTEPDHLGVGAGPREPKSAVKSGGSDNVVVPTGEVLSLKPLNQLTEIR